MNMKKTYTELCRLPTWEQRFEYLKLHGSVGGETFGADRYLNQAFYHSKEWHDLRRKIILRDNGCDLGFPGYEIAGKIYIHHMNPIEPTSIISNSDAIFDPENLICVSYDTHNAIHYGDIAYRDRNKLTERKPNDTCPWRSI